MTNLQKAAFFDVDGTLTTERVWKGMMTYFKMHHLRRGTHLVFMVYHYFLYLLHKLKLISQSGYRKPWAANLAWFLRGMTEPQAQEIWDWVANHYLPPFWRSDILENLHKHMEQGDLVMLVSAGPASQLRTIAKTLGVSHAIGTEFILKNGKFTGKAATVCIDEEKATMAKEYLSRQNLAIDYKASTTYADGASDVHLLSMVGNPVATYPDEILAKIAADRGWKIYPQT